MGSVLMSPLLVFFFALGALRLPSALAAVAEPNVLFILADDMGQWAARSATHQPHTYMLHT